jgi:hypothetical protein
MFGKYSEANKKKEAQTAQRQIRALVKKWFVEHQLWVPHDASERNIMQICAEAMFDKLKQDYVEKEQELASMTNYMTNPQLHKRERVTEAEQDQFEKDLNEFSNDEPVECVAPPTSAAEQKIIDMYFKMFLESCAGDGWADLCCAFAIAGLPSPENESPENESPENESPEDESPEDE